MEHDKLFEKKVFQCRMNREIYNVRAECEEDARILALKHFQINAPTQYSEDELLGPWEVILCTDQSRWPN